MGEHRHHESFEVNRSPKNSFKNLNVSYEACRRCHEKPPMCQIMHFSLYCMNKLTEGRLID